MNEFKLASVPLSVFAEIPKTYDEVRYALEGNVEFKPAIRVVKKF